MTDKETRGRLRDIHQRLERIEAALAPLAWIIENPWTTVVLLGTCAALWMK